MFVRASVSGPGAPAAGGRWHRLWRGGAPRRDGRGVRRVHSSETRPVQHLQTSPTHTSLSEMGMLTAAVAISAGMAVSMPCLSLANVLLTLAVAGHGGHKGTPCASGTGAGG